MSPSEATASLKTRALWPTATLYIWTQVGLLSFCALIDAYCLCYNVVCNLKKTRHKKLCICSCIIIFLGGIFAKQSLTGCSMTLVKIAILLADFVLLVCEIDSFLFHIMYI